MDQWIMEYIEIDMDLLSRCQVTVSSDSQHIFNHGFGCGMSTTPPAE
jgi:hypothetical protein